MKRVITAVVLLVLITISSIVWSWSAIRHFRPMQQLAADAAQCFQEGDVNGALEKSKTLAKEYKGRAHFFDLFISHQALFEAEKCVECLPLILQYGDTKDFVNEAKRCELLIERLWDQELPRLDTIF